MLRYTHYPQFEALWKDLNAQLADAPVVDVGEWQSIQDAPQSRTIEVEDVSFSIPVPESIGFLQEFVKPNLPWAEDHFLERVSGTPHNPPPSHEWWPFAQQNNDQHRESEKFSHTYPERFWPKWACFDEDNCYSLPDGSCVANGCMHNPVTGIRFPYGDLRDLVDLLRTRPFTRQAYLPVWFPEDLWATMAEQRVPCTLGYHFMRRGHEMKCVYYMRSCDLYRHFRDDVYMAARLLQWICHQLESEDGILAPSRLVMHISSLHAFEPERRKAKSEGKPSPPEQALYKGQWY